MAITRTPMVDDDGSGRTGTIINAAWKTEFYNQIDGVIGVPVNWVPVDGSGAGLTFSPASATLMRTGSFVSVTINLVFPANASPAPATIAGLPVAAGSASGFYSTYGIHRIFHISPGSAQIIVFHPTTGAQQTNADLSGAYVTFAGFYHL